MTETLVECKTVEVLTLDAQMHCGWSGDLKSNAEQLVSLPFGLGCWGSTGAMLKTTDEVLRMLQSAHKCKHDATTKSSNHTEVMQTFTFNKPHRHYSKWTQLSYNTFIWI